jgi:Flp pilus assembly protein TadG
MRNLTRLALPVFRLLGRDDRGATLVIVAILIAGGVLLGMGAMAIDVGRLYQNRAELQNGADAGALAVAKSCISGTCNTALDSSGVAQPEATANASALTGGSAGVDQILTCFSGQICTTPPGCPGPPAGGKGYVDVRTSTRLANGSTLLPPVFARALLGNSGYPGTNVKACAQAEWGPALQANSIAMTMSYCAWNAATNGGTTFGPNVLTLVYLKNPGNSTCFGPAGSVPGGFDWLSPTASNVCNAIINLTTSTSYSDTGNNTSPACKADLYTDITSYLNGTPVTVYLPVFDAVSGTGSNLTYTLVGMAGFVPVGYSDLSGNPGDKLPKAYGNQCPASPNDPCVKGYFTQALDPVTTIGSGTNYGAEAAKLTG